MGPKENRHEARQALDGAAERAKAAGIGGLAGQGPPNETAVNAPGTAQREASAAQPFEYGGARGPRHRESLAHSMIILPLRGNMA
jgi:hypothetical protein